MKRICLIAGTLDDYLTLTPLIKSLQNDQSVSLTVVSTETCHNEEMEISQRRFEEDGFLVEEQTDILIKSDKTPLRTEPANFNELEYPALFNQTQPDVVILFGNSYNTLSAGISASMHNIPVAHIQGGESEFGTWDDSYGYGITKLAHLHFTSTEKYREQIIRFGEHPDRVFCVGSLLTEQVNNHSYSSDAAFLKKNGLSLEDNFLFISLKADANQGSENALLLENLATALSDPELSDLKIVFNSPESKGLNKIIHRQINQFCSENHDRAIALDNMNLTQISSAVKLSSATISNQSESTPIASVFKTPVINIGCRLKNQEKTGNMIQCNLNAAEILTALQNGLSTEFNLEIAQIKSPFHKASTAEKIKEALLSFQKSDICQKAYYEK